MKPSVGNKDRCPVVEVSVSFDGMTNDDGYCTYRCAVCGEENETLIDVSAGAVQSYVEDCAICCRPNILRIRVDESAGTISVETEFEG